MCSSTHKQGSCFFGLQTHTGLSFSYIFFASHAGYFDGP